MPETVPAAKANWRTTVLGILGSLPLIINGVAWIIQNGASGHGILNILSGLGIAGVGIAASDGANVKSQAQITKP